MLTTFACFTAATIASHCLTERASGFSQRTCFARPGGGDGDLGMGIIGRVDVHDVDLGRIDDLPPVRDGILPAELGAGGLHSGGISSADGVKFDAGLERKKMGCLPPGIRVGPGP